MGKLNFSVVSWDTANGQQLEAIAVKKLAINSGDAVVGANVQMQYSGQIWEGQIMSLHENMKSAKSALENELIVEDTGVRTERDKSGNEANKRKRTKNTRLEEYDVSHGHEQKDGETVNKKQKTSSGKENKKEKSKTQDGKTLKKKQKTNSSKENNKKQKTTSEDAAEKERKQIERERAREEKERERKALAERNNQILNQMAALVGRGDSFTSDVVEDCVEINCDGSETTESQAQITPKGTLRQPEPENNTEMQLQRTITELQNVVPRPEKTITQLQRTLQSLQHTSASPNLLTPPSSAETQLPQMRNVGVRPTVGGKCPRRTLQYVAPRTTTSETDLSDEEEDSCRSCKRLKRKIVDLEKKLKEFEEQVSSPPRPGKIHSIVADKYKMVELTPGSQVFIHQHLLQQAITKPTFKCAASFLLNCFYSNEELCGMNLTGANGKSHPDKDIVESIIGFVMREMAKTSPSPSAIKFSLRNKLTSLQSRKSKLETTTSL